MNVKSIEHHTKMLELEEKLLNITHARVNGAEYFSIDEVDKELISIINEER